MKEYLKMSDYFNAAMSAPVLTDDEMYCGDSFVAEFSGRSHAIAAVHAINSHDDLVSEVERLNENMQDILEMVDAAVRCSDFSIVAKIREKYIID